MMTLLILAFAIIAGLAFYAGKLLFQLKKQKRDQETAEQKKQLALQQHDAKILSSVTIIVKAMQEQQCDLSEGCWRLSVLLDSLKTTSGLSQQFPAIFALYNKVKDMAILDARKKLEKKQRMREDYQRMMFEAEYQESITQDLNLLAEFTQTHLTDGQQLNH